MTKLVGSNPTPRPPAVDHLIVSQQRKAEPPRLWRAQHFYVVKRHPLVCVPGGDDDDITKYPWQIPLSKRQFNSGGFPIIIAIKYMAIWV